MKIEYKANFYAGGFCTDFLEGTDSEIELKLQEIKKNKDYKFFPYDVESVEILRNLSP